MKIFCNFHIYCCYILLHITVYALFIFDSIGGSSTATCIHLRYSHFFFVIMVQKKNKKPRLPLLTQYTCYKERRVFIREKESKREWWGNWTSPSWVYCYLTFFLIFCNTDAWTFIYVGQISFQLWIERAWRDQIGQEVRTGLLQSYKLQTWMADEAIPSSSFWMETLIVCVARDLTSYCRMDLDK